MARDGRPLPELPRGSEGFWGSGVGGCPHETLKKIGLMGFIGISSGLISGFYRIYKGSIGDLLGFLGIDSGCKCVLASGKRLQ